MWFKSTLYVGIVLVSLAIIAKNQFWGTGSTIALDIILAGMAAACVAALRELWKSS